MTLSIALKYSLPTLESKKMKICNLYKNITILNPFVVIFVIISAFGIFIKNFKGEIFDYIYIAATITLFLILIIRKSVILKQIDSSEINKFQKVNHFLIALAITLNFIETLNRYTFMIIIFITVVTMFYNRLNIIKFLAIISTVFFLIEFLKTPKILNDNYHLIFMTDEIFLWGQKSLYQDYMTQYSGILGLPLSKLSSALAIEKLVTITTWYLIILQIFCLLLLLILLKLILKELFFTAPMIVIFMSLLGGTIWSNQLSTLDLLQELPVRKIFPLIITITYFLFLKTHFNNYLNFKKKLFLYFIGIISGISFLNDLYFTTFIVLALIISITLTKNSIKIKIYCIAYYLFGILATIFVNLWILQVSFNIDFFKIISIYVLQYGENTFGHEFAIIGPDNLYLSLLFFLLLFTNKMYLNNRDDREVQYMITYAYFIMLNLIFTSVYWAGRSYSVQINSTATVNIIILIGIFYKLTFTESKNHYVKKTILSLIIVSPFLFNLINYNNGKENLIRIFSYKESNYEPYVIDDNHDLATDMKIFEKQIEYTVEKYSKDSYKIGTIIELGNIYEKKYNLENLNLLNNPTSITNLNQIRLICETNTINNYRLIIVDSRIENLIKSSYCFINNFRIIKDKNSPRLIILVRNGFKLKEINST